MSKDGCHDHPGEDCSCAEIYDMIAKKRTEARRVKLRTKDHKLARLRAENARLREALEQLLWYKNHKERYGKTAEYLKMRDGAWQKARAALELPKGEGPDGVS